MKMMILERSLHIFIIQKRPKNEQMSQILTPQSFSENANEAKKYSKQSLDANWWSRQQQQQTNSNLKLFFPCGVAAPLQNTWQVWILKLFQYAHLLFKLTSRHLYAPIKRNCKKSSCFITVQSIFWHMNIFPWNWNLLSSKIVHSAIKCDWMFFPAQ